MMEITPFFLGVYFFVPKTSVDVLHFLFPKGKFLNFV